ncbi:Ig-like domain repeat protein [uncultured Victivallis sp.]|uniref:Ig-like domain repeat protein n=1 Tax=uncultured Victivallis sp. TaxID=354118 RepID=UPI0025CE7245|nr:Ig-like domain repeat protein [uncultured Victivallis sp.]
MFLDGAGFDIGGSWYYTYTTTPYLTSDDTKPYYTPISMSGGSRVTLGNTADNQSIADQPYNLYYSGANLQGEINMVNFSGDGEFDFSPVTGNGAAGRVDKIEPQSQIIWTSNVVDTENYTWAKYKNSIIPGTQNTSAYGVRSSGNLDVLSDMSAQFFTTTSLYMGYYRDTTVQDIAYIESTSSNVSNAAAFRVGSMSIDNNFTGLLQSNNTSFYVVNYNASNLNSNQITAYGIWSDGTVNITGAYRGEIVATVGNVDLHNQTTGIKDDAAKNANVNSNVIRAIGIQGSDLTFGAFDAPAAGGSSIQTVVDGVNLVAKSTGGDGSSASAINNAIYSIAINGSNITFNDKFSGVLTAEVSDITVGRSGGETSSYTGNSYNLYGINASGKFIANKNFDGAINLTVDAPYTSSQNCEIYSNIYGIRGDSITVTNGYFRSDVTISVNDTLIGKRSSSEYICGLRANTINAAAFDGDITINSNRSSTVTAGILVDQYFTNGNDESFDITGDIDVTAGVAAGILGNTGKNMNIRISGNVKSSNYAIYAGMLITATTSVRYNTDDRVEIAAGAHVVGDIELYNGRNAIVIDSNARVEGNVNASLGTNNVEFVLNDYAFVIDDEGNRIQAVNDDAILTSNTLIDSTVHFTVNLNSVDLSNGSRSYKLYSGNLWGWGNQVLAVKYQGKNYDILADGGSYDQDGVSFSSAIVNGEVIFTVNSLPTDVAELDQVKNLQESFDVDKGTVTLSWEADGTQGSFEVEYRIVGGNSTGKTIVQYVSGSQESITLSNIEEGQTVEWRIRQNIGNGDRTSVWSDGGDVLMTKENYVYSKVENVDFEFSGFSAASAVANLTWTPGEEYSEGLIGYVVRYVQVDKRKPEGVNWDTTAYMEKYVTAPELVVTGLTNLKYFYWQVQAIDEVDANGNWVIKDENWVDGEIFKVYDDDTTAPWFVNGQSAILDSGVTWADPATVDPQETHTMDPTLSWEKAEDDRSGVSRYTIRFRVQGSNGEWTSCDIPVEDDDQQIYNFQLSEWLKQNPASGLQLLENATYDWQLTAVDYSGQESTALTGVWTQENKQPVLDATTVISTSSWDSKANNIYVTITWDPAVTEEGYSKVLRHEVRYRVAGSDDAWTTQVISVKDDLSWAGNLANQDWEYQLVAYNVAGNASVTINGTWLCDNVAPVFTDSSLLSATNDYDLTTRTNSLVFTWSNATDENELRPNSGMDRFELAYYDLEGNRVILKTFDWNESNELYTYAVTVGKNGQLALADGSYKWEVTAYDNAGNATTLDGGTFLIDTAAPTGALSNLVSDGLINYETTSATDTSSGRTSGFGAKPDTTTSGTTIVETVTSIYIDFTFDSTYTDNASGVQYLIQVCDNNKFTGDRLYEFVTSETTLRLDGTNGYGAGCMANTPTHQVYWRVQAMDSMGNGTGNWYYGDMHYFIGEGMTDYATDVDTPTDITSTTVSVNKNTATLGWTASTDIFGVENYEITYTLSGGQSTTITVSAKEVSDVLTLADGVYTWKVRAVDYVGHASAWTTGSKFEVDSTAPIWVNGAGFAVNSIAGSKDIAFSWNAASDKNLAGYMLVVSKKTTSGYITQAQYIYDPKATSYILYNQEDGEYIFTLYAADSFGNVSEASKDITVTVDTSGDAGDTRSTAKFLPWATNDKQTVGGTDTVDWFTGTFDGAATLSFTVSNVTDLNGKNAGVKLNLYDSNGKKIKSYSVKPGTTTLDGVLWDVSKYGSKYYLEVVSSNKNSTVNYTIKANEDLFPAASSNNNFSSAELVSLNAAGTGTSAEDRWVGFGDAADYYKFTTSGNGALTIDLNMQPQSTKTQYKVSLYNADGKKLKNVTVKGELGSVENIFKNDILAETGTYYLVVESGDNGKGQQNGYYDFVINDDYFPAASSNNDFKSAELVSLDAKGTGTSAENRWVGFGDATDYYKFTTDGNGAITIDFNMQPQSAKTQYKVTLYDATGKKLKNVTVKGELGSVENIFKNEILALEGTYFLTVESGDKGKGQQNGYYDFVINDDYFPAASSNNSFGTAEQIALNAAGTGTSDKNQWVGFGDAADYFKFTTTENGALSIDFNMQPQNAKTQYKVSLYDSAGKKLKNVTIKGELGSVENIFKNDVLAVAGTYYLVVESGDKGKGQQNGYYDFTINNDYFLDPQEVNDGKSYTVSSSINTSISGWVGFGDASDSYTIDAAAGSYSISINDVTAQLKVTLTDIASGKKIKTWNVKEDQMLISPALGNSLLKGDTLLTIESGDKGKGKQNSDYSISIVANEIFPAPTTNNDLASATSVNFGNVNTFDLENEWIGYGDDTDFFRFELDSASRVDFDLDLDNKALTVGKEVKVKLYNAATGKTLGLDGALTSTNTLEAGTYAVSVEISNPDKNWTSYDLGITKLA